jgi:hypothetical protein
MSCRKGEVLTEHMRAARCRNPMRDIENPRWMYVKAVLFAVIGSVSSALIILSNPTLQICVLLVLAAWSFCRLYYFAFYVIEKYADPSYKFSGVFSAARYFLTNRRQKCAG